MQVSLDNRTGGVALVVGYTLLIGVLFRDPADGLAAATATPLDFLFFILLPVLGLTGGVYTFLDWPFRATVAFVTSSYLGVVGIAIALLPTASTLVTASLGVLILFLAVLSLVATLRSAISLLVPGESFG